MNEALGHWHWSKGLEEEDSKCRFCVKCLVSSHIQISAWSLEKSEIPLAMVGYGLQSEMRLERGVPMGGETWVEKRRRI